MVAEYRRTLAPTNRLKVGIVQRLIDAQWRLLRNSRLQSLEVETCLAAAHENQYPGLTPADAKYTRQLIREEAALMRPIHASHRERQTVRKLNPSANPPVFPRLDYTGKKHSILDRAPEARETCSAGNSRRTASRCKRSGNHPPADDQSQPAGDSDTRLASSTAPLLIANTLPVTRVSDD